MNNFVCSQCKTEFEVPYKFCKECGGIVEEKQITSNRFCPQCGKEMQSGAQFCSFCGGKAKGSSKKGFLIFLAILIVLGAAGGVGYKFYTKQDKTNEQTGTNKKYGKRLAAREAVKRHVENDCWLNTCGERVIVTEIDLGEITAGEKWEFVVEGACLKGHSYAYKKGTVTYKGRFGYVGDPGTYSYVVEFKY